MKTKTYPLAVAMWVAMATVLGSCGGEGIPCGAGTVEVDGRCLPEITACGPGTVAQGERCVPACGEGQYWDGTACAVIPACGSGTVFDAGVGGCVPACQPGERWDGAGCVPQCAPGTVFDAASGRCLAAPERCGPGTRWVGGQCVSELVCGPGTHAVGEVCLPDTLPEPDVVESAQPGQAAAFELPAAGAEVLLGGGVDSPRDENGDGLLDADWDAFAFAAPAGTYLRMSGLTDGAALPAFVVLSEETSPDGRPRYIRYALDPVSRAAAREVYLPRAGNYQVLVTDLHNLLLDVFGAGAVPVGGADFSYRLVVRNLGAPAPQDAALPLASRGDHAQGRIAFWTIKDLSSGDVLGAISAAEARQDLADDVIPALMLFGPDGTLVAEDAGSWSEDAALALVLGQTGSFLLVGDFLLSTGPRLDYDIAAWREPVQECGVSPCQPRPLAAGEHLLWRYGLAAFDLFAFAASVPAGATESLGVALLDSDLSVIGDGSAGPTWIRSERRLRLAAGPVYLWIDGWSGGAVPEWQLWSLRWPVPELPAEGVTGAPVVDMPDGAWGDSGLVRFSGEAGQVALVNLFAPHDAGGAWAQPAEEILDTALAARGPALDVGNNLAPIRPTMAWFQGAGTYLHRTFNRDEAVALPGASYDVQIQRLSPLSVGAPAVGSPVTVPGLALAAPARAAFLSLPVVTSGTYRLSITPAAGSGLRPRVRALASGYHYSTTWVSSASGRELGQLGTAEAAAPEEPVSVQFNGPYNGPMLLGIFSEEGAAGGTCDVLIERL